MELLDIVDEENNLTGKVEDREIIHKKGLWHREVGICIMNEEGKVFLDMSKYCIFDKETTNRVQRER